MKVENQLSFSDILFISIFSLLVFFGAFFIFSELQKSKADKQVSIRSLDQMMNQKVNKRLKSLQGRKILLNSKMNGLRIDTENIDSFSAGGARNSKYDLEVFDKSEELNSNIKTHSGSTFDQAMFEASFDDGSLNDKADMVNEYRNKIIKMAAERGWRVEVDQDLNITSAVPIKK